MSVEHGPMEAEQGFERRSARASRPALLTGAAAAGALLLAAVACEGGGQQGPATSSPRPLTPPSPHLGGPGGAFEYCDGPICATNADGFAMWDGLPMKILWRVEEAYATDEFVITGWSDDGRHRFVETLGRATSPDDLPGYHYFPSGLPFASPGVWLLELDSGKTIRTIIVKVEQ